MRRIFVIIVTFSCFLLALAQQQQRVLKSKFEGSLVYDSLVCGMGLENGEYVECPGAYCKDDSSWIFNISDSVYREYRSFNFFGYLKAPTEISYVHPCFRLINGSDSTAFINGFLFWEDADTLILRARLVKQDTIRNSRFHGMDKVVMGQSFDLLNPTPELQRTLVNMSDLYMKYRDLPSNQFEKVFADMIVEASNSPSSMVYLYDRRNWFTLQQLMSLYALFSENRQHSYYGRKLNEYLLMLTNQFQDTVLANCLTKEMESIVMDENKYTLLVFSASWCAPCHELIPTLKELYEKKKDVLNIVYVTLDEPRYLPAWQKFIKEKSIPWRSLSVDGKIDEIREKYKVPSIPYSFLIYPRKMKVERVEIRDEEDKVKIETL